jgi:hypothetical protein
MNSADIRLVRRVPVQRPLATLLVPVLALPLRAQPVRQVKLALQALQERLAFHPSAAFRALALRAARVRLGAWLARRPRR